MALITDIVGYAATVVGTCLMLPQIVKTLRTHSVEDLSFGMVLLYLVNCVLWLVYGILIHAVPVAIANGIGLVISVVQLELKLKYRK